MSENIEHEKNSPLIENQENITKSIDEKNENEDKDSEIKNITMSSKTIESIKSNSIVINRNIRWLIFFIFIIINLLMNYDHGTVPAATEQLRNYLNLTDSELGLFGSLVFIGVIIGSLVSLTIINTFNRKYILMVCLILCGLSLFLFIITKQYVLLCIDRVIIGIFQAFISIYLPLWCEQFGVESRKAIMMALIQVAPPLGVLVGYMVTTLLNMYLDRLPYFGDIEKDERWLYSFYIQSFVIWGLSLILFFFPDKYFNSKSRRVPLEIEETLNNIEKQKNGNNKQRKLSFFYNGIQNIEESKESNNSSNNSEKDEKEDNNSIDKKQTEDNDNNNEKLKDNNNNEIEDKKNGKKLDVKGEKDIPFLTKLKLIFSEPLFILCVLILSVLFFIVTCVQYWTSDYMLIALEIQNETQRLFAFSVV